MASPKVSGRPEDRHGNNVDDLTRFDAEMEDAFNGFANGSDAARDVSGREWPPATNIAEALGIDEEITISKKRKPVAKLDSARLLSPGGIPTLQRICKSKFKFRGKGHEFSDVALLLRTYQLWLDDLYPRAKFADALQIIEQLGHSKQMQMMRKQWIDESRREALGLADPESTRSENTELVSGMQKANSNSLQDPQRSAAAPSVGEARDAIESSKSMDSGNAEGPDEDELDALLAEESNQLSNTSYQRTSDPEQDELDALLDENDPRGLNQEQSIFEHGRPLDDSRKQHSNNFEDDEEALREMEMM